MSDRLRRREFCPCPQQDRNKRWRQDCSRSTRTNANETLSRLCPVPGRRSERCTERPKPIAAHVYQPPKADLERAKWPALRHIVDGCRIRRVRSLDETESPKIPPPPARE